MATINNLKSDEDKKLPSIFYRSFFNENKESEGNTSAGEKYSSGNSQMTQQKTSSNLGLKLGLYFIGAAYLVGMGTNTAELSDKIEPLREQFIKTAKMAPRSENMTTYGPRTYNYNGALSNLANVKNEFAKDNGAYALRWDVVDGEVVRTPPPLALNPFKWNDKIDVSSLKPYLKK